MGTSKGFVCLEAVQINCYQYEILLTAWIYLISTAVDKALVLGIFDDGTSAWIFGYCSYR